MSERTKGQIAIYRDHSDAETAAHLIFLRPEKDYAGYSSHSIADIYSAPAGSEQEANAEFLVKAWGAHDQLVADNATLRADLSDARSNWESGAEELRQADLVREQLVAAGSLIAAEHRAVIDEAAQVLESAAAHNRAKGRTVLERTQQDRADRLRLVLAAMQHSPTAVGAVDLAAPDDDLFEEMVEVGYTALAEHSDAWRGDPEASPASGRESFAVALRAALAAGVTP